MLIQFSDVDEFFEDIKADLDRIEPPGIIRMTACWTPLKASPFIQTVSLVASVVVPPHVVRLIRYVGEDWGKDFEATQRTHERAIALSNDIKTRAQQIGLQVRGGMIDVKAPAPAEATQEVCGADAE